MHEYCQGHSVEQGGGGGGGEGGWRERVKAGKQLHN